MAALLKSTTGTLAQIQTKTNSLTLLSDIVKQICPDLPEDAWQIANCREQTMVIEVKSPVWGQRLQFERNTLCQALTSATENQVTKIAIKVNPQGFNKKRHEKTLASIPQNQTQSNTITQVGVANEKTAKLFLDIAENAPEGLKEKLTKLAKVAGKK